MAIIYDDQAPAAPRSRITYDAPAAPENTWGGAVKGVADLALSAGSHALVDPVAALARTVNRVVPEALGGPGSKAVTEADINALQERFTHNPSTPEGQVLPKAIAPVIQPVAEGLSKATGAVVGKANVPAVADIVQAVPLLGAASRVGRSAAAAAPAAIPSVEDPVGLARGLGLKLRPSDVGAATGEKAPGAAREAFANSSRLADTASTENVNTVTRHAAKDLGLDKNRLTDVDYDNYRSTVPGPTYDKTATSLTNIGFPGSPTLKAELDSIVADQNPATAVTPKARSNINRIQAKIESGNYTGTDWRTDVSELRKAGAKSAADALEDEAERHLAATNPQQLEAYRTAREQFAKSYDYQGATVNGQIDATKLGKLDADAPGRMTGVTKAIATVGRRFPNVLRVDEGGTIGASVPHSRVGILGSAIGGATRAIANPMREGFQTRNFGRRYTPAEMEATQALNRNAPVERPPVELTPPPGTVSINPPQQLGMTLAQGPVPRGTLELTPPEGEVGVRPVQEQVPLLPPQKRLGEVLSPEAARRLGRILARKEGVNQENYIPALGETLGRVNK